MSSVYKLHATYILDILTPFYPTALSSTFFLTNIAHLYTKNDAYYFYSFLLLFTTSIVYHQSKNAWMGIVDRLCVLNIVIYGGCSLFLRSKFDIYSVFVITMFMGVIWLYIYGFITSQYVFDSNGDFGDYYHMVIHAFSSIGHHAIIGKVV